MEMYGEYHTKVWILLWKCMENITQKYGYYYGNVRRISYKSMDIIMGMYGYYYANVWILLWECKENIMQMYGEH